MSNKEKFISDVEKFIEELSEEGRKYFEELKNKKVSKEGLTDNGKKILAYMQENYEECDNTFKAAVIGEGIFTSGRAVSGAIRKLITDGYVEKNGENPVTYSLTDFGKEFQLDK